MFAGYDYSTLPAIPAHWKHASFRHDACPSWSCGEVQIFVDYPNSADRESGATYRFSVVNWATDNATPVLETDNWADVIATVARINTEA